MRDLIAVFITGSYSHLYRLVLLRARAEPPSLERAAQGST